MSKVRIHASDGHVYEIDAPDGMSDEDIQKQFETQMGGANAAPAEATTVEGGRLPHKGEEGFQNFLDAGYGVDANGELIKPDQKPTSQTQGFVEGIEKPFNNAAQWAENGLNMLGGLGDTINKWGADYLGTAPSVEAGVEYQKRQRDASPYQSGGFGKFAGEAVGTALASRIPGGAFIKGAQTGALLSDDPNNALGVGFDTVTGGVGGQVGSAAFTGLKNLAAPVVAPALQTLINAGVRVTPGTAAKASGSGFGKFLGAVEDKATSRPFVGGLVEEGNRTSMDDFARATINRTVAPIGEKLPDSISLNTTAGARSAVKWAGDKLSAAYKAIAPKVRVDGSDPAFVADLAAIDAEVPNMLGSRADQFNSIRKGLERYWRNQGTTLSGDGFKAVDERLGQHIRRFSTSPDADQQQLGQMLESLRDAMWDAAQRQNPAIATELKGLNTGWKSLTQVERATANSKGLPTPKGYSDAVKMSSDTVRRRGYARGEALNQDLSDAASDLLPSTVPDSGTAGRLGGFWQTVVGGAQALPYLAAQKATPAMTRGAAVSPAVAKLLQLGSKVAPYVAPQGIEAARRYLTQ